MLASLLNRQLGALSMDLVAAAQDTPAAARTLWPDDLGEPLIDDDLIRNGLWDR